MPIGQVELREDIRRKVVCGEPFSANASTLCVAGLYRCGRCRNSLLDWYFSQSRGILMPAPDPPSASNTPTYNGPLGIPAIPLRADLANSSGARFTEAEVRQYFATHRPRIGHPPR